MKSFYVARSQQQDLLCQVSLECNRIDCVDDVDDDDGNDLNLPPLISKNRNRISVRL